MLDSCVCVLSDVRHEYISGYYRVSVYFLAKVLSDMTLRTITSVIFSCIVYFMIGKTQTSISVIKYDARKPSAPH